MAGQDIILRTEDLTKEFAGFVAVSGVALEVTRGSIHALIGPNGAGKTTCFNLLTKFLQPTRGRILFKGEDITNLQPADIARLGLVRSFQISAVFPHMTVLENVRIALQRKRGTSFDFWRSAAVLDEYNDRAAQLIADVGLTEFAGWTAVGLLCAPVTVLTVMSVAGHREALGWVTLAVGPTLGTALLALGVRLGGRTLDRTAPDLLRRLIAMA